MKSKIVLVTGCTRGLGRAMVDGFVAADCTVVGCGRSELAIANLASDYGSPHFFSPVDTSDDAAVGVFAEEFLSAVGVPDLVLNNAALINANATLWEVPPEEFSRVVDVNIKGVHSVIRHLTPAMIDAGRGVIVNFSSGWGRSTSPEVAPYCATKWAIEGMTAAMAQELPSGLATVALNPGTINTDMLQSCFHYGTSSYRTPREWAKSAVPFLLKLGAEDNGSALTAPG